MGRVALKIAYDGEGFHGYARQPGVDTVEGEILRALRLARIVRDAKSGRFQSASRTDRGVSALGNVVAFDTSLEPSPAGRAMNAKMKRVWAWGVADVPADFNPRRARERCYRYVLEGRHDPEVLSSILALFVGDHDFRSFTRDRTRTRARVDVARAYRDGDIVSLEFRAPGFRWNLVRRLVAAALQVEAGDASRKDIRQALEEAARLDFGLAPPEPLTLVDVLYDFEFHPLEDATTKDRIRGLVDERAASLRFAETLRARFVRE